MHGHSPRDHGEALISSKTSDSDSLLRGLLRPVVLLIAAILGACSLIVGSPDNAQPRVASTADAEFFETRVRPVLAKNCYACHGADQQQSSLRVDSREALVKGGARGPSIVPGHPEKSLLVKAVRHDGLKMPIGARLKEPDISA